MGDSEDFYGAFEAQEMGKKHAADLDMTVVDYPNMVYVGEEQGNERGYATEPEAKSKGIKIQKLSGTEFRKRLRSGDEIPEWFAFPSVVKTLATVATRFSCKVVLTMESRFGASGQILCMTSSDESNSFLFLFWLDGSGDSEPCACFCTVDETPVPIVEQRFEACMLN